MRKSFFQRVQWPAVLAGVLIGCAGGWILSSTLSTPRVVYKYTTVPATAPAAAARAPVAEKPLPRPPARAKVAIVLDDWGYSRKLVPQLLALKKPLTIAILPNQTYSTTIARAVQGSSCEVILHLPMEPHDGDSPREPQVLTVGMSPSAVRKMLDQALATVPYSRGINNHQGSKATEDPALMQVLLSELRQRQMFFLDSVVTDRSVCKEIAQAVRLPFAQRSVFLDNVETHAAVRQRLLELAEVALRRGSAVGIGHDKQVTLEALQQAMPEMERQGIEFVHASELVSLSSTAGDR